MFAGRIEYKGEEDVKGARRLPGDMKVREAGRQGVWRRKKVEAAGQGGKGLEYPG